MDLGRDPLGRILEVFIYRMAEFFVVINGARSVFPEFVMMGYASVDYFCPRPARPIPFVEGVGAVHHNGDLGEVVGLLGVGGGVRPGPSRGHEGVIGDVSNLVVDDLVNVAVHHGHLFETRKDGLYLFGVISPEIPGFEDLIEGRMGEDDNRGLRAYFC